jgi:EmrB/QacA subfamily drug resistance transporter
MLCGLAWSPGVLIGARAVQGLFGAIMLPQGLGMLRQMFPPDERAKAFGAFGPVMGLSTVGGPILAGWLTGADYFGAGWRMIFFINLPLGVFAIIGALKFLPADREERTPRLDVFGVLLAAAGAFLLLYPLVQGRELDWPAWVFVMLAAGVIVFGLFGRYEATRDRQGLDPLVTPSLFRKKAFTGGLTFGMLFFGGLVGTGLIFTLYLQIGLGYSPLKSGLTTLPQALGSVAGFVAAGSGLAEKLGRKLLQIGVLVMLAGAVVVAFTVQVAGTGLTPWHLIPGLVLLGAGMGLAMAPFFDIVLAGVDDHEAGSASGAITSVQQLGGAFGIAVLGTIFFGLLPGAVGQHVDSSAAELRGQLTVAGVPDSRQPAVVAAIRSCLQDRVAAKDPDAVPESCQGGGFQQISGYAQNQVRAGFQQATVWTLSLTVLLLIAVFGSSFLLPRYAKHS